jgi:hypothetical protein
MRSIVLGTLLIFAVTAAQSKTGDRDPDVRYDTTTVADITGVVESIREVAPPAPLPGIHLVLKAEDGSSLDVYLGPVSFVKEFVSNFGKRSQIQVIGSKAKSGTATIILAREVRRAEITLYLRDKHGKPFWSLPD